MNRQGAYDLADTSPAEGLMEGAVAGAASGTLVKTGLGTLAGVVIGALLGVISGVLSCAEEVKWQGREGFISNLNKNNRLPKAKAI